MRILQIYELNPLQSIGGVEFAILQLSKELTRLGHEVTILTDSSRSGEVFHDRLRIISIDFLSTMRRSCSQGRLTPLRQILFMSSLLSRRLEQYDVYHGHIYTSGILTVVLILEKDIPLDKYTLSYVQETSRKKQVFFNQ